MENNDKKTKYEKLEKALSYSSKNIWFESDKKKMKEIFDFGERYKEFLRVSKSERLTVKWIVENAERKGYINLLASDKVELGNRYYAVNRNKNVALIKIGRKAIEEGVNFIVAHGDAPRLDLKQVPLMEDTELALLKTHYYGGVKKYQWLNIPLALTGVVVTAKNRVVDIVIGLNEDDPIFVIPDLEPHLAKKAQSEKKANDFIEGETLNLFFGNIPVRDKNVKEKVKIAVLEALHKKYGINEEDFISAELEAVPAIPPRDVGIDRALIGGYGHDDRVSTFCAIIAIFDAEVAEKSAVTFIVDKEEIGSEGPTGAKSLFIFNLMGSIIDRLNGECSDRLLRQTMEKSVCVSADVNSGMNPMYKGVHDEKNAAKLSHGVVLTKYTGSGGKYSANDADAELVGKFRNLFNENGIFWQYGGLGKVDEGGGGTIAKHLAFYNSSVIDCGVPVVGMHSPYELISKADLYYAYRAYKIFFEKG